MNPAAAEHHQGAADTMALLLVLAAHAGVLPTSEVARRADVGRDSARRILRALATQDWVRRFDGEDGERWSLGPELPRLGLAYQRRLVEAAEALSADFARLTAPIKED